MDEAWVVCVEGNPYSRWWFSTATTQSNLTRRIVSGVYDSLSLATGGEKGLGRHKRSLRKEDA